MIKRLSLIFLLVTPAVYADWIDDLLVFVEVKERSLDYLRTETAVQKLLDEDKEAMRKHAAETSGTDNSFWGNIAGYFNLAKWGVAKKDSWYHQQVLDYVKELPKNQEAYNALVVDLIYLNNRKQELKLLLEEFETAQTMKEKSIVRVYIVGKKTQIAARKKFIEKRIFIS